ncbi:hypothetical protein OA416_03875 [Paracoccaceae bacterium]|nr:hypothetical protein [Paracoccaceae bacterium]
MFNFLKDRIDYLFGRGKHSIFVPVMDGALKPNEYLDSIKIIHKQEDVDNLTLNKGTTFFSAKSSVFSISNSEKPKKVISFSDEITAMAVNASGSKLAVSLNDDNIIILVLKTLKEVYRFQEKCVTSMCFNNDALIFTTGSQKFSTAQWQHDLLSNGCSGTVCVNELNGSKKRVLIKELSWPTGITFTGETTFCISEAWMHRISFYELGADQTSASKLDKEISKLPAYPGKSFFNISNQELLVCFFAPRNQLVEFILTEEEYKTRMMAEIDPSLWVAPTYRSGKHIREPLQQSGIKTMGYLKPWAPAFSYGLVVRFDGDLKPLASYHSRTNGNFHGTTSVIVDKGQNILVTSRGDGKLGGWK